MMNFLMWNVRGAGKDSLRSRVKKLIVMNKVCLLAVIEPKMAPTKLRYFSSAVGMHSFMVNPLAEKNMWLLWNDNVEVRSILNFEQAMTVSVSFLGAEPILVTVVYGCCD
ncbi:unnamed protein product [Ilex paraguariensis]|uniref:Uncharacterized protein n=1 Tax=Ilex paraguariensis TaxID=185542 RepID=A0ABC8SJ56_9AQUA